MNRESAAWFLLVVGVIYFIGVPLLSTPTALQASGLPLINAANYPIHGGAFGGGYNLQLPAVTATATATQTQYVPQTQTQYVSQTSSVLGASGASCQIALSSTAINMGENIVGQLTSNRAGVEVDVYHRLVGEPVSPQVITGLTDAQGSWIAFSGQITTPGIYQIFAALNFPSQGVEVPCTPIITVTVHGFTISVNPDSVGGGFPFTVDVYSDMPGETIEIQYRLSTDPVWITLVTVPSSRTNMGGHYTTTTSLSGFGDFIYRAYDRSTGALSNEEWIWVGL